MSRRAPLDKPRFPRYDTNLRIMSPKILKRFVSRPLIVRNIKLMLAAAVIVSLTAWFVWSLAGGNPPNDNGNAWAYAENGSSNSAYPTGTVFVNCTHTDTKGTVWTTY